LEHQRQNNRLASKRQPGGLAILYEDKDLLVVEKPAGLLTVGTDSNKTRTAHYLLNDYVRKGNPKSRNRVYVVHRLDQDTSGLLIFARSEQAKRYLQEHWEETEKHYLAVVHGQLVPEAGRITSCLVENAAHNVYSSPDCAKGKLSHTDYRQLRTAKGLSLVDIHLVTGRKHQIRVHFAERGHPVVGDKKYGQDKPGSSRLALHARSITFTHPFSGRTMQFDTGLPDDFARLLGEPPKQK
jgi:RluA family pseudouridine synthase